MKLKIKATSESCLVSQRALYVSKTARKSARKSLLISDMLFLPFVLSNTVDEQTPTKTMLRRVSCPGFIEFFECQRTSKQEPKFSHLQSDAMSIANKSRVIYVLKMQRSSDFSSSPFSQ